MNILRIADIPAHEPGGMHGYMLGSGEALRMSGHEVRYMFREDLAPRLRDRRLRRTALPWLIAREVHRRHLRGERLDVVEIHEPLASAYCLVRGRRGGRDLPACAVLSYGTEERLWRAQRERWRALGERAPLTTRASVRSTIVLPARYALRNASHVLVPSSQDLAYAREELGVPGDRVSTAYTGVAEEFFAIDRRRSPARDPKLVFVGSWIDRKGIRELSEAWGHLAARHPRLELTLLGTGRDRRRVAADLPRATHDRITVRPKLTSAEIAASLGDHDVFVLPSWFEGMPLSLLEAAAAGLACVVTGVGGALDFFPPDDPERHGGVLVQVGDARGLSRALERLLVEPELARRLGGRARARARRFTWGDTAEQLAAGYERARRRASGPDDLVPRA